MTRSCAFTVISELSTSLPRALWEEKCWRKAGKSWKWQWRREMERNVFWREGNTNTEKFFSKLEKVSLKSYRMKPSISVPWHEQAASPASLTDLRKGCIQCVENVYLRSWELSRMRKRLYPSSCWLFYISSEKEEAMTQAWRKEKERDILIWYQNSRRYQWRELLERKLWLICSLIWEALTEKWGRSWLIPIEKQTELIWREADLIHRSLAHSFLTLSEKCQSNIPLYLHLRKAYSTFCIWKYNYFSVLYLCCAEVETKLPLVMTFGRLRHKGRGLLLTCGEASAACWRLWGSVRLTLLSATNDTGYWKFSTISCLCWKWWHSLPVWPFCIDWSSAVFPTNVLTVLGCCPALLC